MKKKILPVLVAIVLMLVIGGIAVFGYLKEKYSYGTQMADLNEYFKVSAEGEAAIILQDSLLEEKAVIKDGICYFDLDTVHRYLNEIFYIDREEKLLLYTNATQTIRSNLGEKTYTDVSGSHDMQHVISYEEGDTIYLLADFVKLYTNFSYEVFERQVQIYTEWGSREVAELKKDTQIRVKGGIKSPILRQMQKGETVEILDQMETWCKVKSTDSIIGYVENKYLINQRSEQEVPVTDYTAPEYTGSAMDGKVSLGWHSIGGVGGNDTLHSMVAGAKGMNVIAPTWFSLNDNEGGFRSFASADYVTKAQAYGLKVWGVLDDFNYANETGTNINVTEVLSSTASRQKLVQNITDMAVALGLDGINLDFERVNADCGVHYVQFLRELSVLCRDKGLVLSIDNYVPFHFNEYYRLDIQGQVADYVIIMGYDEHWHGSDDPGSVASIDYVANGITKTVSQVPAGKVINALPFYTIVWCIEGADVSDQYLTLNNTADFLKRIGAEPVWDEVTCQNFLEWTSGNKTYRVWIEDVKSIAAKLNVMNANNVGGVAAWRLGYGTQEVWNLLSAYVNS